MEKNIFKIVLSFVVLSLVLLVFMPYFTTEFLDLRQKKENEENYQKNLKEKETLEKAKKDAEKRNYLMGKFDPAQKEDFVLVPEEYRLDAIKIYLRKETWQSFLKMHDAANKEGVNLKIVSATRNFDYQKNIWDIKWETFSKNTSEGFEVFKKILEYSAVPGTSRHHWGTDIDINGVNPPYFNSDKGKKEYEWLRKNALSFGFCQTYNEKDANRLTGYNEEKWHWSYLPLARAFAQEYKNLIRDEDIKGFLGDEYVENFNLIQDYVLDINMDCI